MSADYDLAIIGGGINGCGIARDASGRGLSVLLVEQGDLASGTSSASTKLIHGGLRYLEHYAFRLVRESLQEREVLLHLAPHIIRPMRFVLPHVATMRPAWLIRSGLFLYDHLGGQSKPLPPSAAINLTKTTTGKPLQGLGAQLGAGFEYSDCWADDARLVILNALDAAYRSTQILTKMRCVAAEPENGNWEITLQSTDNGSKKTASARCLINATGPWLGNFLQQIKQPNHQPLRLVQGSHIVTPKLYDGAHAYLLQNDDGRVVFTIPYENDFTLVGTTDRDFHGDPKDATVSDEEVEYLQNTLKRFFGQVAAVIVHRFCGVRALAANNSGDAQKANRDYLLKLKWVKKSPLLNIYGGKLTTYRKLAEAALNTICGKGRVFPEAGGNWSAIPPLPGGELSGMSVEDIASGLVAKNARLSISQSIRLARAYGTIAADMLPKNTATDEPWKCFGADLCAWEVDYLMDNEWARCADDVLWRRSVLGLRFSADETMHLDTYMQQRKNLPHA